MAREWTDEEVKKEIADAVQIVREDRLESFLRKRFTPTNDPDNPPPTPPPSNGDNPPATKKRGLWWGDAAE